MVIEVTEIVYRAPIQPPADYPDSIHISELFENKLDMMPPYL